MRKNEWIDRQTDRQTETDNIDALEERQKDRKKQTERQADRPTKYRQTTTSKDRQTDR